MKVEYYQTSSNRSPIVDFILSQPVKARAKIQKVIDLFGEKGMYLLGTPYFSKLSLKKHEIYELRIKWSGFAYRIFVVVIKSIAHLVHIFIKKEEETRQQHIKLALKRKAALEKLYC